MAAQPVYPIGVGMFTPVVSVPMAGEGQGVTDMAAPQLVMLANVALTSEGTNCESLMEEKQMVELKTVGSGSYSDSEDEALTRFGGFDGQAEAPVVVYDEAQSDPPCQTATEPVPEETRNDQEGVEEPEQDQSPAGAGKRKRIQRPVEPPKKKKPFHCKPCQYQAECEEDFVHHIRRHSAKKLIVVNGAEAEAEGAAKDSASSAEGGEGLVYTKGVIRCERCGYNTNRYDHYVAHLKHHTKEGDSQRVYKCTICTYTTISQYHWKKHLRNHFPSKLYTCAQCCYFSDRKNNYVQHIRTHTGERPFRCPYCKYSSSQKTHLTRHMRTHSGERPFKCETCSYLAANQHEVTRHARQVHNGPKPLSCPHCQYKTADRSNYKKHVELHVNPRQFLCPVCSYAASKKCNLQYHIKSRHPDCSEITMDVSKVKLRVKKPDSNSTYYNVDGNTQYVLTGIKERKGQVEKKSVKQANATADEQQNLTPMNLSMRKSTRPASAPAAEKERKDKTSKKGEQNSEKAGTGKAEKGLAEEKGMEKQKAEKCERRERSGGRTRMEKADCDGKQAESGLEKVEKKKEAKKTTKASRLSDGTVVKMPNKRGRKSVKLATGSEEKDKMEKVEKKKEKAEKERMEKERTEKARVEKERVEKKRAEKERVEKERAEKERVEKERAEKERLEKERAEKERAEKERAEKEKERVEKERAEKEKAERERVEKERTEREKLEREQAERKKLEKERAEKERVEKEQVEKEKLEKEQAERERVEKERTEREKVELKNKNTMKSDKSACQSSPKVMKDVEDKDQGRDFECWELPRKCENREVTNTYGKRKAEELEQSSHCQEASEPSVSRKSRRKKAEDMPLQASSILRSKRKALQTCQATKGKDTPAKGLDLPVVIQLQTKTKKVQSKKKQTLSLVEPSKVDKNIVEQVLEGENPTVETTAAAMEAEHQVLIQTPRETTAKKDQRNVEALLGLLGNPVDGVNDEERTEMEHGRVSSAPKEVPEARAKALESQKGEQSQPSSTLELPRTGHKPAETEEDEGIHSHDGSDISDNVSEGSDDSGLSGSGKLAGPETPTEEVPPVPTPTALPSHTCIFCDRTFPMEVEYRRHLNRHLVNVYYLESAASEEQ
ncbi:RE1-silencing transcription factor [Brienomyrus brachyistius]|uniref:RE1-silencing transcription factor n=1 Tax=Brienomyrus brachyistius TaxID=42636 RepID=UPI0020B33895|nr:RE1-silencing transcription factor [Brienomyrus brachyistius]XP_048825761.1 RE1-silencing transcription factor [Brienomyrus brachyistius]